MENSVRNSLVIREQILYENKSLSNFHINFRCNLLWNGNLNEKKDIKQRDKHNPWGRFSETRKTLINKINFKLSVCKRWGNQSKAYSRYCLNKPATTRTPAARDFRTPITFADLEGVGREISKFLNLYSKIPN